MIPAFVLVTLIGLVALAVAAAQSGWLQVLAIALGAFVTLFGGSSVGFFIWGRYVGFGWHFTR